MTYMVTGKNIIDFLSLQKAETSTMIFYTRSSNNVSFWQLKLIEHSLNQLVLRKQNIQIPKIMLFNAFNDFVQTQQYFVGYFPLIVVLFVDTTYYFVARVKYLSNLARHYLVTQKEIAQHFWTYTNSPFFYSTIFRLIMGYMVLNQKQMAPTTFSENMCLHAYFFLVRIQYLKQIHQ